jgi:hypothetical protein
VRVMKTPFQGNGRRLRNLRFRVVNDGSVAPGGDFRPAAPGGSRREHCEPDEDPRARRLAAMRVRDALGRAVATRGRHWNAPLSAKMQRR